MRKISAYWCFLILLLTSCQKHEQQVLRVAVAANMSFSILEIAQSFELEYDVKVEISTASSGLLTSQIINGAPFDVFIAANMEYPLALYNQGLATEPVVYAFGNIVLAAQRELPQGKTWKEVLLQEDIKRIAIADPKSAPYGIATLEALRNEEVYLSLLSKIVLGESVTQVNQYLSTGSVDLAFTSNAFKANFEEDFNYYEIPNHLYRPIEQGVSIIKQKQGNMKTVSELFINYLKGETGNRVLLNHGFSINE